jgi:hypothetical protein
VKVPTGKGQPTRPIVKWNEKRRRLRTTRKPECFVVSRLVWALEQPCEGGGALPYATPRHVVSVAKERGGVVVCGLFGGSRRSAKDEMRRDETRRDGAKKQGGVGK